MGISISCLTCNNQRESINNGIYYVNIASGVVISAASLLLYYYSWTKSGCEKPFIPEDIIRLQILTRLPVKSLARFQCVCKSWKSLNSDPAFVNSHVAHNLIHPEDDAMIFYCHNLRVADNNFEHPLMSSHDMRLGGSVNGLVCTYTYIPRSNTIAMIGIWNPSTRMYKDVPPPSTASIKSSNFFLTLGFDHIKNDYKVIFVSRDDRYRPLVADVYSCNAGSWCNINVSSNFVSRCPSIYGITMGKIIHVNGSIYWKIDDDKYIQTFDIIDEVFRVFPDLDHVDFSTQLMILVSLKNSLAQIVHNIKCNTTYVDVYVLNQTMDCDGSTWIKLYRVGPIILLPGGMTSMGCFNITGDLVFNYQHNLKLLCIDEEKQVISKMKKISLDRSLYLCEYLSYGIGYTRTLVFVRGMKHISLECQHTLIIGCKGDIVYPSLINY